MLVVLKRDQEEVWPLRPAHISLRMRFAGEGVRSHSGLATGTTMVGVYRELVRLHREEHLDFFAAVTTFNFGRNILDCLRNTPESFSPLPCTNTSSPTVKRQSAQHSYPRWHNHRRL